MDANIAANASKEKEILLMKEKEKEKEREREGEMEAALYTNCLLLGLDAAVLGNNARVGLFKHSNPRVGEALLHFLLSALRGPSLSAKDFAGVWPIFDAAQSRDFRKIVQNLINELEAQGALPRSNSRVSSLATCCGQRFVELLWQLSAHALREVHKRNFPADVAANPLPPSLTEIVSQNSHAASLLSVTKARIALERRRFLEEGAAAVRRQGLWTNLANDLTAEFRGLCAEEAQLNQELDKIYEMQDQRARSFEGPILDDEMLSVETATELWGSLLEHTEQHEKLGSGPVEDLIAHREHRYRVDGSALRTAIDRGSNAFQPEVAVDGLPHRSRHALDGSQRLASNDSKEAQSTQMSSDGCTHDENRVRNDEKINKASTQLDVAEILRRWTHALNRLHKQALRLAKANDGAGPELLKDATSPVRNGHSQTLESTLAEHKQHLSNMQTLVKQLKVAIPGMEVAIATLRQQVHSKDGGTVAPQSCISTHMFPSKTSAFQKNGQNINKNERDPPALELVPPSPALKLPQLLSTSPTSMDKVARLHKRFSQFAVVHPLEALREEDVSIGSSLAGSSVTEDGSDTGDESMMSLRQAVREAALAQPSPTQEVFNDKSGLSNVEPYFTPIHPHNTIKVYEDKKVDVVFGKPKMLDSKAFRSPSVDSTWNASDDLKRSMKPDVTKEYFLQKIERTGSPPLLTDMLSFDDGFDDLLGMRPYRRLNDVMLAFVVIGYGVYTPYCVSLVVAARSQKILKTAKVFGIGLMFCRRGVSKLSSTCRSPRPVDNFEEAAVETSSF